ncbi:MAG: hypothetical protein IKR48_01040 [Kiritimatiellae bacterium]|nr:hypothetical protein [Kiritimatiellia bacterium]
MKNILPSQVIPSTACFRQRITLPRQQVKGLSRDELAAALSFEVEPFSGIPRSESELAWRTLDDGNPERTVFDVVQIRKQDLALLLEDAKRAKKTVRAVTAVPAEGAESERIEDLPWIVPSPQHGRMARYGVLYILVCVLLCAGILCDGFRLIRRQNNLRPIVEHQRTLQVEKDSLMRKLQNTQKEIANLRTQRTDQEQAMRSAQVFRAAWQHLLEVTPKACGGDALLRSITPNESAFSATIQAIGVSPKDAVQVFVRLSRKLAPLGWQLTPGAITVQAPATTVSFSCQVTFHPERVTP